MNIFDYAMSMEKEGEAYYRDFEKRIDNEGLKKILTWLADEEVKHYNIFVEMKENKNPLVAKTNLLKNAKAVFEKMSKSKKPFDFNSSQPDLYRKAQQLEKKTIDFYLQKSEEVERQKQKELLVKIAEEEKKHYFLLDNIIEFITRPEIWLENAEFTHLEEY